MHLVDKYGFTIQIGVNLSLSESLVCMLIFALCTKEDNARPELRAQPDR